MPESALTTVDRFCVCSIFSGTYKKYHLSKQQVFTSGGPMSIGPGDSALWKTCGIIFLNFNYARRGVAYVRSYLFDLKLIQQVEAVYENGVLRPLAPITLNESQRVRITIVGPDAGQDLLDAELFERARAEVSAMGNLPTIEQVKVLLSTIPGSVADAVIAEPCP